MSTQSPTRAFDVTKHATGRFRLLWIMATIALVIVAAIVGWLVRGGEESEAGVDVEIEEQINALIDGWLAAKHNGDGQAALDLFTEDGRFVTGWSTSLEGWSGEELKVGIERLTGPSVDYVRSSAPLIIEQSGSYHVAYKWKFHDYAAEEYFDLFTIVDEDGALKIRYAEQWMPLGWFRLAEDLPYQRVNPGG